MKEKVKKRILIGSGVVVVLFVATYLLLGTIVRLGVGFVLPMITKTDASIENLELSLLSGKILLKNLEIKNPENFSKNNAFEIKTIQIEFEPLSFLSSEKRINSILIDGVKLNYELESNGDTNLNTIIANMSGSKEESEVVEEEKEEETEVVEETEEDDKSGSKVIIDFLDIKNSEVSLNSLTLPLPDIHKEDIGKDSDSGIKETFSKLLGIIMGGVDTVVGAGGKVLNTINSGTDMIKDGAGSVIDSVKDLF